MLYIVNNPIRQWFVSKDLNGKRVQFLTIQFMSLIKFQTNAESLFYAQFFQYFYLFHINHLFVDSQVVTSIDIKDEICYLIPMI